jgi:hypothetical protein
MLNFKRDIATFNGLFRLDTAEYAEREVRADPDKAPTIRESLKRVFERWVAFKERTLTALLAFIQDEKDRLEKFIASNPEKKCKEQMESDRTMGYVFFALFALIAPAGAAVVFKGVEPLRFGSLVSLLYALGIAIGVSAGLKLALQFWYSERHRYVLLVLSSIAFLSVLIASAHLAVLRAKQVTEQQQQQGSVVVIESAPDARSRSEAPRTSAPPSETASRPLPRRRTYYEMADDVLWACMLGLGYGLEIISGILLYLGTMMVFNPYLKAARRVAEIEHEEVGIRQELDDLHTRLNNFEDEWQVGEAWAVRRPDDRRREIIAAIVTLIVFLLALFLMAGKAWGADSPAQCSSVLIGVDITQSTDTRRPGVVPPYRQNFAAVEKLLAQAAPGQKITVAAIHAATLTAPRILLTATLDADPGYFKERITNARQQLIAAWRRSAAVLKPEDRQTSVFGAFLLASQILPRAGSCAALVVLSDMLEASKEANFESLQRIDAPKELAHAKALNLIPDLAGIDVYVLGTQLPQDRSIACWMQLRQFWSAYVQASGGRLRVYTVGRDL